MILDEILEKTKDDLEKKKKNIPFDVLGRSLSVNPFASRDVIKSLKPEADDLYKIIAEIKKSSPSKGIIRENFDPINLALEYENGGANALSILTQPHFFGGDIEFISLVKRYTKIPILRKDFIIDEYQILEAAVYGADFVLLIATILSKKELKNLFEFAKRLELEVLVEVHDKKDIEKALFAEANIIGINHRNLQNFEVDTELSKKLIKFIPNDKIIVAESGLKTNEQLKELNKIGVDAFLIGETFMRQDDVCKAVKSMKGNDNGVSLCAVEK